MKLFAKLNENPRTAEDYIELFQSVANSKRKGTRAMKIVVKQINEMLSDVPHITNKQELENMLEILCVIYDAACKSGLSIVKFNEVVYRLDTVKANIQIQMKCC